MKKHIRLNQILEAAYILATAPAGWIDLTRRDVANEANCAEGLINKYFNTMEALKNEVMELAITRSNLKILEQGLVYNNKIARNAPVELIAKIRLGV